MRQTRGEVESIKRRGIRRTVGRRALKEIGRLVEEHQQEERVKRRLVLGLWLPLAGLALLAALAFVAYRMLA